MFISSPALLVCDTCVQNGCIVIMRNGRVFSCNIGMILGKDKATHIVEEHLVVNVSPEIIAAIEKFMDDNPLQGIKDDENIKE